jgi:type I restriction enzyme S subunit
MAREMKNSGIKWVGTIPREWGMTKIKYEITGYKAGPFGSSLITDKLEQEGKILVYTPEHIALMTDESDNDLYLPETRRYEMSQFLVKTGDIVFPIVGSLGRAMEISSGMKNGIINQRLAKFRLCSEKIYGEYFMWLFSKSSFYGTYIDVFRRGTIIVNLTKSIVNEMPIPLPPLPEQKAIADFLDKKCAEIDGLLVDLEAEVKALAEYKKSIIAETVTRGLNPNAPMKQSGIPWAETIPAHWDIQKGKYTFRLLQRPVKEDDGVITCFRDGEVTLRSNRREDGFTLSAKEYGYQGIEPGDLVVHGMDGFAGSIGISDSRGKGTPVLNVLDSKYNKRYLMYYLRNMAYGDVFLALSTGIRVRSCDLGWKKLGEICIVLPPIEEQEKIADYIDHKLDEIQNAIVNKTQQIETLKAYKSSLIYEYVTGKKQVI